MKNLKTKSPVKVLTNYFENQGLFIATEDHNFLSKLILKDKDSYSANVINAAVQINMSYFAKSRATRISIDEVNIVKEALG